MTRRYMGIVFLVDVLMMICLTLGYRQWGIAFGLVAVMLVAAYLISKRNKAKNLPSDSCST